MAAVNPLQKPLSEWYITMEPKMAGLDLPQGKRNAMCFQNQPAKQLNLVSDSPASVHTALVLLRVRAAHSWSSRHQYNKNNGKNKEEKV